MWDQKPESFEENVERFLEHFLRDPASAKRPDDKFFGYLADFAGFGEPYQALQEGRISLAQARQIVRDRLYLRRLRDLGLVRQH
jgi:hypothetical protein